MPENQPHGHSPEVVYPHQISDEVSAEDLGNHFAQHPEAYHPHLHLDIRRVIDAAADSPEESETVDDEEDAAAEALYAEAQKILSKLDSPDATLSVGDADTLFEASYGDVVKENIYRFNYLDAATAYALVQYDAEAAEIVMDNVELFDNLDQTQLAEMLSTHQPEILVEQLGEFHDLDPEIVTNLAKNYGSENGLVGAIVNNLGSFRELPPNLAEILMENSDISEVIEYRDVLDLKCDDALMNRVIERAEGTGTADRSMLLLRVADMLHAFEGINPTSLEVLGEEMGFTLREYPRHASEQIRDRWFGEMSYAQLGEDWNTTSIGRIIRLRIEQGIESNIHNASQWLSEFKIPDRAFDTVDIMRRRQLPGFDIETIQSEKLYDSQTEKNFISAIVHADPALRKRLNLSSKPERMLRMFHDPGCRLVYSALIKERDGVPLYKKDNFDSDYLEVIAENLFRELIDNKWDRSAKHMAPSALTYEISKAMTEVIQMCRSDVSPDGKISEYQEQLLAMGSARERYVADATRWLNRHATSPYHRLTKVWKDRAMILMNSPDVSDNARDLERWQNDRALAVVLRAEDELGSLAERGFTISEIMSDAWEPWRKEILRVRGAEDFMDIVTSFQGWRLERQWQEKLLPAGKEEVRLRDRKDAEAVFQLEILDKDDPRGFTIGEDTGCCMTVGGESEDCIAAGYQLENAGFLAISAPNGNIAAQSFWYVHPDHGDVLVLDNIEANAGRDLAKITNIYTEGLRSYLEKYNATHPDAPIRKVHVGTGYTDVGLSHLESVDSVPALNDHIYTDAHQQKLLLDLT